MNKMLLVILAFTFFSCNNDEKEKASVAVTTNDSVVVQKQDAEVAEDTTMATDALPQKLLLKFNLQKGKQYSYTMETSMQQQLQEKQVSSEMDWKYRLQVLDRIREVSSVKVTYDRIAMSMDMGGQKIKFSSEDEVSKQFNPFQMMSTILSKLKGKSFTMQVTEAGEITSISGFDKIGEEVVAELQLPEQMKTQALSVFRNRFNDAEVKQNFSQVFAIFPQKAVGVGDTWKKTSNSRIGNFEGKSTTTFTVKQVKDNRVTLTGNSRVTTDSASTSGKQNATIVVDANTGLVLKNNFQLTVSGEQKLTATGKITGKAL